MSKEAYGLGGFIIGTLVPSGLENWLIGLGFTFVGFILLMVLDAWIEVVKKGGVDE